ncbi:MAG TPA: hypothetical protein VKW08_10330 [Xanthobacteraceae bacterium]|nr:hypothetical protein [Xanthobacteraceae bacterium]
MEKNTLDDKASGEKALGESKQETLAAGSGEAPADTGQLEQVDSPTISPVGVEESAERAAAGSESVAPTPHADLPTRDIIRFVATASTSSAAGVKTRRRFNKLTALAASVVAAAAFGAMAGVLGATVMARLASEPAPQAAPDPTIALQSALSQLRSEVASLKAGVDAAGRNTTAQYNKLSERFDRVERAQSATPKSDAAKTESMLPKDASAAARDATGSITPANPAASVTPTGPLPGATPSAVVPGWAVRDVYRGVAMLQSRVGAMVEVEPGDILPGLGRIEAIRRQDGRWVVITSHGMIVSMR